MKAAIHVVEDAMESKAGPIVMDVLEQDAEEVEDVEGDLADVAQVAKGQGGMKAAMQNPELAEAAVEAVDVGEDIGEALVAAGVNPVEVAEQVLEDVEEQDGPEIEAGEVAAASIAGDIGKDPAVGAA